MADRYWVGGTASWDGTAGTKWALTSGGAGGQAVPTSADDVFFDAASGANTVTIATGNTGAKSINCTGFTGTLAGSANITVSGSVTLVAGMTVTYTGTLTLAGTGTLTSAGKTLGPVTVSGSGITVTLGDALTLVSTSSGILSILQGTFTTSASNYSITCATLRSDTALARTVSLNGSTLNLGIGFPANGVLFASTNLTFNAGTSQINIANECGLTGAGVTFYNVAFTGTTTGVKAVTGTNTFNNFSVAGPASAGVVPITFDSRQTINGTLSTTGTAGNRRVWFRGVTYGLAQTLTVNATPSLTDADFRDLYIVGTAAPISGTRIGNLRGCSGITFSTPKTVYWNLAAGGNWSANAWAASSGAGVSTDNFPLAQDTAIIENTGLNTSATVTIDAAFSFTGSLSMQTRTNAFTLGGSNPMTFYGDLTLSSAVTLSYNGTITFSGRNTQIVTSAGKSFNSNLTIDSYNGTIELADAFSCSGNNLTVTNGTFDTKNYNVTIGNLSSSNSNIREIRLGSSTVSLGGGTPIGFATSTNLTLNAGTSQINITANPGISINGDNLTFYDVSFTGTGGTSAVAINFNNCQFRNLTFTATAATGLRLVQFSGNNTITGTLTVAGASPIRRIFVQSTTFGTTRTLTVGTLSATDCDFRDITIAGAAAGSSPTRAGNCGGNTGITFPAAKTVYWNLAGAQNWSATAWAPGSGGTPDINNFPLAQDTAVFDNTGSVTGTITIDQAWNIGTFDASLRTSAMTLNVNALALIFGDWKFGTGITHGGGSGITFSKRGTQTITSNGITFNSQIIVDSITGTLQLADALLMGSIRQLNLVSGTFDAVSYNVTLGQLSAAGAVVKTLKMGSGTWTLSGASTVWDFTGSNTAFYKGTANIVLSDTSTSARTFNGGGLSYNKLTIGGTTGISTTTITGNNQFTELASTKTVAHTIALGSTIQTFGKWTVTGTVGNLVTLTGSGTSHILAGACTSGIDYLAMGSIGFSSSSPGEFYAGANSTGTAGAPVYLTAKPADSTRYWVGGTGNWSDTARWSTGSGGASGASVPRSHDDVVFDAASNATAYTATVNAVTGGIRMKSLTIAGPASGNLTLAGSTAIFIHNNVTLPATGLTRTYTGAITLSGSTTGRTLTTNGVALASAVTVNGVDCGWSLGSALDIGTADLTVTNGTFDCVTYNLTAGRIISNSFNSRTIDFGTGTISVSQNQITFGTLENQRANLAVVADTSQINMSSASVTLSGNNQTFYNLSLTSTSTTATVVFEGANSFNNLSFTGITAAGLKNISLTANQTVTGTLTFSAGTNATMRHFCRSDTIGTTRTITAAAVSMTDVDFRDITIAGAAAPASGTRIGDCKGNSGITFTAATTRYWNLAGSNNWSATGWAANAGDAPAVNNFPLAQDTCVFTSTSPGTGTTTTINAGYNIGTIDMSARTTNTMTLACSQTPLIYGNWINGTGTTLSGVGRFIFAGRGSQTITSAGVTFTQAINTDSPGGSVTLQDALSIGQSGGDALLIARGTFNANIYNVTFTSTGGVDTNNSNVRTVAIGSGTWSLGATSNAWNASTSTNLTVTGTGTISLTSASAKTFAGGGIAYTDITLNQGGAGTLTITGSNTFKDITNTYKATGATNITMGTTTQRVSQWTAAGEAGRLLTIQGTSATSPCTLVHTGTGTAANVDYLVITGVRAY